MTNEKAGEGKIPSVTALLCLPQAPRPHGPCGEGGGSSGSHPSWQMPCAAGKSQATLLLRVLGCVEMLILFLKTHAAVEGRGKVSECRCPLEAQISCFSKGWKAKEGPWVFPHQLPCMRMLVVQGENQS